MRNLNEVVADSYINYHSSVFSYIYHKIENKQEAEDITQDVFVRLMDYKQMIRPETIKCFIFTIARNLVMDYFRYYYAKQRFSDYIYLNTTGHTCETESLILARDLAKEEKKRLLTFSRQRKIIYKMNRYENKSTLEIANLLHLSRRTVENHLFIGRKEMREYIRRCI